MLVLWLNEENNVLKYTVHPTILTVIFWVYLKVIQISLEVLGADFYRSDCLPDFKTTVLNNNQGLQVTS